MILNIMSFTQVTTSCSHQQAFPSRKASSWLHEVPFHEISPVMCTMLCIHINGKKIAQYWYMKEPQESEVEKRWW